MSDGFGKIVYGPGWPDPSDCISFLEQCVQFTRAANGDNRPFSPNKAYVILVDDRDGELKFTECAHDLDDVVVISIMDVLRARLIKALDESCRPFD